MNELTNKEIQDYLKGLPDSVINAIVDKTWSKRTNEIALKYSLTEEQTNTLRNLVLFVIIGVESPKTLQKSIEVELGISNLLSEQLMKDIDNRVFQYIYNLISENQPVPEIVTAPVKIEKEVNAEKGNIPKPLPINEIKKVEQEEPRKIPAKDEHTDFDVVRSMSKDIEYLKNNQDPVMHNVINKQPEPVVAETPKPIIPPVGYNRSTPEIRPESVPMVEPNILPAPEMKVGTVPHNLPGIEIETPIPQAKTPDIKIDDLGDGGIFVGSEFMKQSTEAKQPTPENIKPEPVKWGSAVDSKFEVKTNVPETSTNPLEKKEEKIGVPRYTSDPYREPLE